MAKPRYRLQADHFFAPTLFKQGSIVDWDGKPSINMEPLNEEAQAKLEELYASKPHARINPLDELAKTMEDAPSAPQLVSAPKLEPDVPLSTLADAQSAQATAGVTDGGELPKLVEAPADAKKK